MKKQKLALVPSTLRSTLASTRIGLALLSAQGRNCAVCG